jgi:hypothetical protein
MRRHSLLSPWRKALNHMLGVLSHELMSPISEVLREHGCERAVIMPSGLLSLLPLHAACCCREWTLTQRSYGRIAPRPLGSAKFRNEIP